MEVQKAPKHPSTGKWMIATVLLFITAVLALVAVVIPMWSRIPQDNGNVAPLIAAGQMTFTVQTELTPKSVLYMGHWQWCLNYGDYEETKTCQETTGQGIPAFNNSKCKGNFYASRILGIIAVVFCWLAFFLSAFIFLQCKKWKIGQFWKPPSGLACVAFIMIMLALGCLTASWATWMVTVETSCRGDNAQNPLVAGTLLPYNPIQGYSTSFVLFCTCTGLAFIALIMALMGLLKLKKIPQDYPQAKEEIVYVEEPMESSYMAPVTFPVEPTYASTVFPSTPLY